MPQFIDEQSTVPIIINVTPRSTSRPVTPSFQSFDDERQLSRSHTPIIIDDAPTDTSTVNVHVSHHSLNQNESQEKLDKLLAILVKQGKQICALYELQKSTDDKVG